MVNISPSTKSSFALAGGPISQIRTDLYIRDREETERPDRQDRQETGTQDRQTETQERQTEAQDRLS